jgi:hypothetical protein
MSGIVFLLGVVSFVLVAYWAFANDRMKVGSGETGLLRMKCEHDAEEEPTRPHRFTPQWSRSARKSSKRAPLTPKFRRTFSRYKPQPRLSDSRPS